MTQEEWFKFLITFWLLVTPEKCNSGREQQMWRATLASGECKRLSSRVRPIRQVPSWRGAHWAKNSELLLAPSGCSCLGSGPKKVHSRLWPNEANKSQQECAGLLKLCTTLPKNYWWLAGIDQTGLGLCLHTPLPATAETRLEVDSFFLALSFVFCYNGGFCFSLRLSLIFFLYEPPLFEPLFGSYAALFISSSCSLLYQFFQS